MTQEDATTRDKILHTAFGLFLSQGYETTPIQAIIDSVGIAKGTFYHHYKSKEALLVSLVEGMSQRVVEVIAPVVDDPGLSALEKMLEVSRRGVAKKVQDFGPETLVLARQLRHKSNRLLADSIQNILRVWIRPLYLKVVRQGVEEGSFHVRNPETATDLVLGMLLAMEVPLLDLFIGAADGEQANLGRLHELYLSLDQAIERLLGAAEGSLPVYSSIDIKGVFAHFIPPGKP